MGRKRLAIILTVLALAAFLCVGIVVLLAFGTHPQPPQQPIPVSAAQASTLAGLDVHVASVVPRAFLTQDYDHVKEHVPPYGSDGEMQDREKFATAPLDPFALSERNLGQLDSDVVLRDKVQKLSTRFISGEVMQLDDPASFEALCKNSSLDSITLLQSARGFHWLGLLRWGDAFDRAAISKAASSFGTGHAGDPQMLPLIRELDATALLWELKDAEALEKRFDLAEALNPSQSVPVRRAHVLRAIVLRDLHRNPEGAVELTRAWQDAATMNDLTPRDTAELQWLSAIVFVAGGQFGQAEPYCKKIAELGGEHAVRAAQLDAFCLVKLGRPEEAAQIWKRFQSAGSPTTGPTKQ